MRHREVSQAHRSGPEALLIDRLIRFDAGMTKSAINDRMALIDDSAHNPLGCLAYQLPEDCYRTVQHC